LLGGDEIKTEGFLLLFAQKLEMILAVERLRSFSECTKPVTQKPSGTPEGFLLLLLNYY